MEKQVRDDNIVKAGIIGGILTSVIGYVLSYFLWGEGSELSDLEVDRLRLGVEALTFPGLILILLVIKVGSQRFGNAAQDPTKVAFANLKMKIDMQCLTNSFEQTLIFAIATLSIAVYLPDGMLWILPTNSALFTIGRIIFYVGYHTNVLYRAPGFGMGLFPSLASLLYAAVCILLENPITGYLAIGFLSWVIIVAVIKYLCINSPDVPRVIAEVAGSMTEEKVNFPYTANVEMKNAPNQDGSPKPYSGVLERWGLSQEMVLHRSVPINGEVPTKILIKDNKTRAENFYVRNHHPIPELTAEDYKLRIHGLGLEKEVVLTLSQIKEFPKCSIDATLMCAGNRRSGMMRYFPKITGDPWRNGAISNAKWTGCKLIDVLNFCGFRIGEDQRVKYVRFEGYDEGKKTGTKYGSSIPISQTHSFFDVMLAWEMNDAELPIAHGYPVRVVIPGCIAARSIKWLKRIELADSHYEGRCQRVSYKVWTPRMESWDGIKIEDVPPIHHLPVQAACCSHEDGDIVTGDGFNCRGYAISGGGCRIVRVDISINNGESWQTAELMPNEQEEGKAWSWTLWYANVKLFKLDAQQKKPFQLVVKATDSHHNTMPDTSKGIINVGGYLNNEWYRVNLVRM